MRLRCQRVLGAAMLVACGQAPGVEPTGALLVRSDAASAAECPHGGSIVSSGIDRNGDTVLQDGEIATRTVVCKSAPGQLQLLVRLIAEPPGEHCRAGGTAVQSGPDRNRNARLDDDEVAQVRYRCREPLLSRFAVEPPGPNCLVGGLAFFVGPDRNGDDMLEDAEVEVTDFECGDVVSRDVAIRTDADAAALADIRIITGTLRIQLTSLRSVSLLRLEHVGGSLEVLDNPRMIRLALPVLRDVDGDFTLSAGDLSTVECPQLQRVGRLELELLSLRDTSGLAALATVDGDVRIAGMLALVAADLPRSVGGDVSVIGNEDLARLGWIFAGRTGRLEIRNNPQLDTVNLAAPTRLVATAIGPIELRANDRLAHVAMQADEVHSLAIAGNPAIRDISLSVSRFESDVSIGGVTVPFSLVLDDSRPTGIDILGGLTISGPLSSLQSFVNPSIRGSAVFERTLLRTLDGSFSVSSWSVTGGLRISDNPRLVGGSEFRVIGGLEVTSNALLQDLSFVSLRRREHCDSVVLVDNPLLARVPALAEIRHVHGRVEIAGNPRLTTLFGPALARIEGAMRVADSAGITSLQYPDLVQVASLDVSANGSLQTLEIPALVEVPDHLFITANPQLRHIDFTALSHTDDFQVIANPQLPTCEVLAVFAHTTGSQAQSGNDDTAPCAP